MKHFLLTGILIICSLQLLSQDWAPVYPGDTTIYRTDSSEFFVHTLWVDSVEQSVDGQIWRFNPYNHLCDTCDASRYCGNLPLMINQPFPFGEGIVLEDSSRYLFDQGDQGKILLLPKAAVGTIWVMDSINMISATISSTMVDSIWGVPDSLKIIQLSTGDSILLSQNYGMLSFPDSLSHGNQIHLAGILNRELGEEVLDFWDIYDFQVGDVLFYEYGYGQVGINWKTNSKVTILNKEISQDTIRFNVLIKARLESTSWGGGGNVYGYDSLPDTWTFINTHNRIVNALPNALHPGEHRSNIILYPQHIWEETTQDTSLIARSFVSSEVKEVTKLYTADSSYFYGCSFPFPHHLAPPLFSQTPDYTYQLFYRFEKGLGQTIYGMSGFESGAHINLVGHIRDGDTVGTVYTNEYLFVSTEEEIDPVNIQLYPNPTRNRLSIRIDQPKYFPATVSIRDLHGRLVLEESLVQPETTLSLQQLPTSLYHLEVLSDRKVIFREKVLVRE